MGILKGVGDAVARRRRAESWQARRTRDRGLTLVEVTVATAILLIVLVPLSQLLLAVLGQASASRDRLSALSVAEKWLETLNNQGPPTNSSHQPTLNTINEGTTTVGGIPYAVTAHFTWAVTRTDVCSSATDPKVMNLQVLVTWQNGTQHVRDRTQIGYPATGAAKKGYVLIRIEGSTSKDASSSQYTFGTRESTVPIKITKAGASTSTTVFATASSTGCVFEPLTPGTYSVSVSTPASTHSQALHFATAWVANANESTSSQSASFTVVAGIVSTEVFEWDEGAYVSLAYPNTSADIGKITCPNKGSVKCVAFGVSPSATTAPAQTPKADLYVFSGSAWVVVSPSFTTGTTHPATRLASAACTNSSGSGFTNRCFVVGTGKVGTAYKAFADASTTATFTTGVAVANATAITSIVCPTTASTTVSYCYASGWNSQTPALLAVKVTKTTTVVPTWSVPTLSPPTGYAAVDILGLACAATKACYSLVEFKSTTTSTLQFLIYSIVPGAISWTKDTLPATSITGFQGLYCNSTITLSGKPLCYVTVATHVTVTSGHNHTRVTTSLELSVTSATNFTKWVKDTLPTTTATFSVKSVTHVTCITVTKCFEVGTYATTLSVKGLVLTLNPSSTTTPNSTTWTQQRTVPSTVTAITTVACQSATVCSAVAIASTKPAVLSLATTHAKWRGDTLTGKTISSLQQLVCLTTQCLAVGLTTNAGLLLKLPNTNTSTTLASVTIPTASHYGQVACSTATHCVMAGGTATAPVFATGTVAATTWAADTPTGVPGGAYINKLPITVSNASLETHTNLEVAEATSDPKSLGPLYPFTTTSTVAATSCSQQLSTAAASVSTRPGTTLTQAQASPTTLPLGILSVQALNAYGQPDSGWTVTASLVAADCTAISRNAGIGSVTTYTLGTTDALGQCTVELMYGYYTVTVTSGTKTSTTYVDVTATSTRVATAATLLNTTYSTIPLPTPVAIKAT